MQLLLIGLGQSQFARSKIALQNLEFMKLSLIPKK